jgi:dTDP-4-amino-4,6-dideoxygalactose transaminase
MEVPFIDLKTQNRAVKADLYSALLKDLDKVRLPRVADGCFPAYHLFVIQIDNRDQVAEALASRNISTGLHYPIPLHLQKAYANLNIPEGFFPVAESYSRKLLSLHIFPELTKEQTTYIVDSLKEISDKF